MPTDGKTHGYGFLDQLSTEQLLELVRAEFESSEDEDDALTTHILEVIEQREKTEPTGLLSDAGQAWEDFQKYYNTPDGMGRPLYPNPMGDSDPAVFGEKRDMLRGPRRLLKRVLPLTAVVAVVVSSMIAAQAMGMDVFGALARWTDETFHFVSGSATDANTPEAENLRQAVQGAFDECGVTIPAPSWYPDDTVLVRDIDIVEDTESSIIICNFMYGENLFGIVVHQYYEDDRIPGYTFEKDVSDVEEYSSNGRLFYIMSNLSENYAVHSSGQTAIAINGKLPLDDLKQIIDSIGE